MDEGWSDGLWCFKSGKSRHIELIDIGWLALILKSWKQAVFPVFFKLHLLQFLIIKVTNCTSHSLSDLKINAIMLFHVGNHITLEMPPPVSAQRNMKASQTALTCFGQVSVIWGDSGCAAEVCASAVMHGSEVDWADVPGKLTTPSAPLTHAIKATAGDAPLPVCRSASAAPFSEAKGLRRRETQNVSENKTSNSEKQKSPTVVLKRQRGLVRLLV